MMFLGRCTLHLRVLNGVENLLKVYKWSIHFNLENHKFLNEVTKNSITLVIHFDNDTLC